MCCTNNHLKENRTNDKDGSKKEGTTLKNHFTCNSAISIQWIFDIFNFFFRFTNFISHSKVIYTTFTAKKLYSKTFYSWNEWQKSWQTATARRNIMRFTETRHTRRLQWCVWLAIPTKLNLNKKKRATIIVVVEAANDAMKRETYETKSFQRQNSKMKKRRIHKKFEPTRAQANVCMCVCVCIQSHLLNY